MRSSKSKSEPTSDRTLALRLCGYAITIALWIYDLMLFASQLR
jgi:hypothetical protein